MARFAFSHPRGINFVYASRNQRLQNLPITKLCFVILRLLQPLNINILQRGSIVAVESHKATLDAGKVERLVILVVIILGAEVFIPVTGHILFEESNKVFEEFEAVLSQFIAESATGDDDAPVGVVADTLAVLPLLFVNGIYLIKIQITVVESLIYFTVIGWTIFD